LRRRRRKSKGNQHRGARAARAREINDGVIQPQRRLRLSSGLLEFIVCYIYLTLRADLYFQLAESSRNDGDTSEKNVGLFIFTIKRARRHSVGTFKYI